MVIPPSLSLVKRLMSLSAHHVHVHAHVHSLMGKGVTTISEGAHYLPCNLNQYCIDTLNTENSTKILNVQVTVFRSAVTLLLLVYQLSAVPCTLLNT